MSQRALPLLAWCAIIALFAALRIDNSERTYFQIDDQIVVWAVDDAVERGNWQPDWYRLGQQAKQRDVLAANSLRHDLPHAHHYNFTLHMLLSAAMIKPLRLLGIETPTIVLLHHIAVAWDSLSLLFVVLSARLLGGQALALCSALLYSVFPLAVQGSHYARPDALITATGSALLYFALCTPAWPRQRWLLASGLAIGIATGAKASQLMLGIYPAIASSMRWLTTPRILWRPVLQVLGDGIALVALTAAVLGLMFAAGDIAPRDFWLSMLSVQLYYQDPDPPDVLMHYSYLAQAVNILHYFHATLGWPLLLGMAAGTIALARRRQWLPLCLLAGPVLLFVLYFASIPAFFDRSFTALAAAFVLLATYGIIAVLQAVTTQPVISVLATAIASWQPAVIQYHLQTDHLREHQNEDRLAFQRQLKEHWTQQTGVEHWIKNIDRSLMFSRRLPEPLTGNPRIYMVEDLNDPNSEQYRQILLENGFVQIAEFRGDFADMPTNSLIIVHEAARFHYFLRP